MIFSVVSPHPSRFAIPIDPLTHGDLVTPYDFMRKGTIGAGSNLSFIRHQTVTRTDGNISSIELLGTNFSGILIEIISCKKKWKCRLQNVRHFVLTSTGWSIDSALIVGTISDTCKSNMRFDFYYRSHWYCWRFLLSQHQCIFWSQRQNSWLTYLITVLLIGFLALWKLDIMKKYRRYDCWNVELFTFSVLFSFGKLITMYACFTMKSGSLETGYHNGRIAQK